MNTIVVFSPQKFENEVWLPTLWSQAKTYYEKHGQKVDQWNWYPCYADSYTNLDKIKSILEDAKPDIFAISMYIWNVDLALTVAKWVKQRWPNCLVVSGGPHQTLKYDINWFKKHDYIDASLPGECYGELFFAEVLDNYQDSKVDWNLITDARYPSQKSRTLRTSRKTMLLKDKKNFDYQWSSFASQKDEMLKLVNYRKDVKILAVLETTRGCPYGCTYCDWGGGISTIVRKKELEYVIDDLKFLTTLKLSFLFIADANLGIFGDRDLTIVQELANLRKSSRHYFSVGYGGFAKTNNKMDVVKEIIKIDIEHEFSYGNHIKLSQQSLDPNVLKNIDRKNIDLDIQLAEISPLVKKHNLQVAVELILGLPGITLEKFYEEISVLGENNLIGRWYEWMLLPEAPAYDPTYRKQHQIRTVRKNVGWQYLEPSADMEIVVGSSSYTSADYLEMILSTGIYHAITLGGLYSNVINWLTKEKSIELGEIIKEIYKKYYQDKWLTDWQEILNDPNKYCFFKINNDYEVFVGFYFVAVSFLDPKFNESLGDWLVDKFGCPENLMKKERKQLINCTNSKQSVDDIIKDFRLYKTNVLKRKKLFGIFNL